MSIQQIADQQQKSTSKGQGHKVTGIILLAACVAMLLYTVLAGAWIKPDLGRLGMDGFIAEKGAIGGLTLYLWLFSLPLAMILGVLGVMINVRAPAGRIWACGAAGVLVLIVPLAVGGFIGESVPAIFGTGGVLIEVFLLLLLWFWAKERATLKGRQALAADLRLAGYMFFAFVAWDLCGIGSQPVYALHPEKMIEFGMRPLALQMMYGMLTYFVIGWGLTFASHFVAVGATKDTASQ